MTDSVKAEMPRRKRVVALPLLALLYAVIVVLPSLYSGNVFGAFLLTHLLLLVLGLVTLITVAFKVRRQPRASLLMLLVFCSATYVFLRFSDRARTEGRWLLYSRSYKAKVLSQRADSSEELKHIEWDGWGGMGAGDTTRYLVFDPNDTLAIAASYVNPGKFKGLPCAVAKVSRLETNWYIVLFYTNTAWGDCPYTT